MALRIAAGHYNETVREAFVPSIKDCIWISDDLFEVKEAIEVEKSINGVLSKYLKIDSTFGRVSFGGDAFSIRSCLVRLFDIYKLP